MIDDDKLLASALNLWCVLLCAWMALMFEGNRLLGGIFLAGAVWNMWAFWWRFK